MAITNWLKENYFLVGIFVILIFAVIYPQPGIVLKEIGIFLPLTFLVMFLSGLGLPLKEIKGGLTEYKNIIACFIFTFIMFPIIAYFLYSLFNFTNPDIYVGIMILAVQSSTLASATILTMAAGGNVPLALIVTIVNNISAAFVSPFILKIVLSMDKNIVINVQDMILKLVLVLVLPIILAQILRYFLKDGFSRKLNPYRKIISKVIILIFILAGASIAVNQLNLSIARLIPIFILVILLHIIILILAILYARLVNMNKESRTAIMLCGSQKTLPASLVIWGNYFPGYVLVPIILVSYHIIQLIIDSLLVNILNESN